MRQLANIVGEENYADSNTDKLAYSTDASRIEGNATAIVYPRTAEQVRQLIRYADRTGLDLVARGAGTGLAGGAVPRNSVIVDFSRMRRIKKIDARKMNVVVEPGVVLGELNRELEKFNLMFPVRPSSEKVCTIGGLIATNAAGNLAVAYGKTSDWIEELQIIDGTGKQFTLAGREAADFAGSEGTAGLIVEATLKLTAPKKIESAAMLTFDSVKELVESAKQARNGSAAEIEFIDRQTAKMLGLEEKHYLIELFQSEAGSMRNEEEIKKIQQIRDAAYPALASNGYNIIEDPQLDLSNMTEFIDWLQANNIPSFGHIGIGIIHPCFASREKITEMYNLVRKLGGKVSGEHGIGLKKKSYADIAAVEKIRQLKNRFDPENILNKGKVV